MKKLLITILTGVACVSALAQGKVQLGNDSLHLVVMGIDSSRLKPADAPSAGMPAPWTTGALPSGTTLVAGLYAGATAGSLTLQTSVAITGTLGAGRIQNTSYVLPTLPGGVLAYFQVKVWESAYASYEAAIAASAANTALLSYASQTDVFSGTPGNSLVYPPLVGGSFSWLQGAAAWQGGGFQTFNAVPEPSSMVLAGLGAASLLLFRRRK
jgi:hypothetical protein